MSTLPPWIDSGSVSDFDDDSYDSTSPYQVLEHHESENQVQAVPPPTTSESPRGIVRFRAAVRKIIAMNRANALLSHSSVGAEPGVDPRREGTHTIYGHILRQCSITCIDYSSVRSTFRDMTNKDFIEFLADTDASQKDTWCKVRWIHVGGISWEVISALALKYDLHPLMVEDIIRSRYQKGSKANYHPKHLYLRVLCHSLGDVVVENEAPKSRFSKLKNALTMRRRQGETEAEVLNRIFVKVIPMSIALFRDGTVISVHPDPDPEFLAPITSRLRQRDTLLRTTADPSFLVQSILDLVVDRAIEIVDQYHVAIGRLERSILVKPDKKVVRQLYIMSGDITLHKRNLEPIKALIHDLMRYDLDRCIELDISLGGNGQVVGFMSHKAKVYLKDVHDHMENLLANLDTFAQTSENLINYSLNTSQKLNKSMRSSIDFSRSEKATKDASSSFVSSTHQESVHIIFSFNPCVATLGWITSARMERRTKHVYENLFTFLMKESSSIQPSKVQRLRNTLAEAANSMRALDPVSKLVHSHQYRVQLLRLASDLRISDDSHIREALRKDEADISNKLRGILSSDTQKKAVLCLEGDSAQCLLNLIQTILDKGTFSNQTDDKFSRDAHRLLVRLSEASDILPTSLSITNVALLEKEAAFGGGFADIYRALYREEKVALKRMRVFQRDNERHKIHRMICREALVWQRIKHPYVLPFLGIDSETFPPFLCLVSPWMEHGTILKHMVDNGNLNIDQRIYEIAQGLEYLHSQNIIHGDLRGANILIDSEWHARIADFGLTVLADGTVATHTSNSSGSARWMAPELHDPESFGFARFQRTRATDVYAFACTCLEVHTGSPPFLDILNDSTVMLKVMNGGRPEGPPNGPGKAMSNDLWGIVVASWNQQPSERPNMSKVVELISVALS